MHTRIYDMVYDLMSHGQLHLIFFYMFGKLFVI